MYICQMQSQRTILISFILIFSSFSLFSINLENHETGLFFRSYEQEKDERTSLNLTSDSPFAFENGFSISFDIQLRSGVSNYGYVFRIIANDTINIDLVSIYTMPNHDFFALTVGNKSVITFQTNEFEYIYNWMNVEMSLNPQTNKIRLKLGSILKEADCQLNDLKLFDVFFGVNHHPKFSTTDVCAMTIRDICIYNSAKEKIRYWELGKHGLNEVYDSCVYAKAYTQNPVWRADSHCNWEKKMTVNIPYIDPQIAFDNETGRVFIVKEDFVYIYNAACGNMDTICVQKGFPYAARSNQLIYNTNKKNLASYDLQSNLISEFDFTTKEWSESNTEQLLPVYWHHSKQFLSDENKLISVGGYGFHQYKNDILLYSFDKGYWSSDFDSTLITPRYLGGLGYLGDGELLYFGGFGSPTGYQTESPKNYYDLFKIDVRSNTISKLWSLENLNEQYVNGNSIVIDKDQGVFYSLVYPNKRFFNTIRLCKFGIDSPVQEFLGDSIPYHFNDNESYCDLFYYQKGRQLIAITLYSKKKDNCEIEIYTISYPPLKMDDILQKTVEKGVSHFAWIIPILLLTFAFFILFRIWKKRTRKIESILGVPSDSTDAKNYSAPLEQKMRSSSINLLGDFQVIDNTGLNITANFTPIISQIFLLSLLYTIKNGEGISSQKLKDIIWYDKDYKKARNNRDVSVSKLRVIIRTIGNIEIVNNESIWKIVSGTDIFCDYKNVLSLIKIIKTEQFPSKELLNDLLDIASKGNLLANLQWEFLDNFKSEYSNLVIDSLFQFIEKENVKNDFMLVLKIANVILIHDSIDENAIIKKCYALYHLGKKGQARHYFEKFTENHKSLLDTEYQYTFNQFRKMYLTKDN